MCLSAESGTGDDSVILTPTRAEISEPPKVESVIPISNENGARAGRPAPFLRRCLLHVQVALRAVARRPTSSGYFLAGLLPGGSEQLRAG